MKAEVFNLTESTIGKDLTLSQYFKKNISCKIK